MNVYILYSLKKDKFYIGYTSESVDQRLSRHNSGYYGKKHFTASVSDWALFYDIKCSSNKQAIKIERHIKKMAPGFIPMCIGSGSTKKGEVNPDSYRVYALHLA